MSSKKTMATHTQKIQTSFVGGKWQYEIRVIDVEVMASAKGYAMVRRKGCAPFVAREKDLSILNDQENAKP